MEYMDDVKDVDVITNSGTVSIPVKLYVMDGMEDWLAEHGARLYAETQNSL